MGFFSKKKKAPDKLQIKGFPGHVDTCKCLYLAAEKGVMIDLNLLDITQKEHEDSAFRSLSPFGKIPSLSETNLVVSGVASILPFIDIKGGGQSLTPKKAANLGLQNYWVEVGINHVLPNINILVEEHVLYPMRDSSHQPDEEKIGSALKELGNIFSVADIHLKEKKHFANDYSFAEVHWVPYLHFYHITGHKTLLNQYPNLEQWFEDMKTRKKGSLNTYDVLPDLEQINGKNIKHVA